MKILALVLFMALRNLCGFESGNNLEARVVSGTASVQSTIKRSGGFALKVNPTTTATGYAEVEDILASGAMNSLFSPTITTLNIRVYFRYETKPASNDEEIIGCFGTATARKLMIRLNSSGNLVAYNDVTLLQTGSTALSVSTWYRLDIVAPSGTNNWSVKLNGAAELSGNAAFSANLFDALVFGKHTNRNGQTIEVYYDDIAIDDANPPADGGIVVLKANADGTYTAWTGTSVDVDEAPPANTTDFWTTTTLNNAESANMEDASAQSISGTINVVKAYAEAGYTGTTANMILRLRSGSTDSDTTGAALAAYAGFAKLAATDPATSAAWTTSGIDGVQIGAKHNQSQAREIKVTAVYLMVDFLAAVVGMVYGSEQFPQVTWI